MSKFVEIDTEEKELFSTDGAICPYCGYEICPHDDNFELYDDGTTEYICQMCGKEFNVSIYVSYSWTTTKKEQA